MSDTNTENTKKTALFYNAIEALDRNKHKSYGLRANAKTFAFAAKSSAIPIAQFELPSISNHYPIIFVGDSFVPAAALGIAENENRFVDDSGDWAEEIYIPSAIRRYPFILAKPNDHEESILAFDPTTDLIAEEDSDIPFFNNGDPTEVVESAIKLSHHFEQGMEICRRAVNQIKDLDLFCTKVYSFTNDQSEQQKIQFTGINDEAFDKLTDAEFLSLKNSPALDLIFAHRFSLNNWQRITKRYPS